MKLLNLDTLVKVEKAVTLGGTEYPIVEQTLGQTLLAIKSESDLKGNDTQKQILVLKKHVAALVPSLPEEKLESLTFPQLNAIVELAGEKVEVKDEQGKSQK